MNDQSHSPLRTPALDALLDDLHARIRRGVWMHGLGTLLVVGMAWLGFAFLADWVLRVPGPVRVLHTVVLLALTGWFLWRDLLRPLTRVPDRAGLAVLIEREHPDLHELLVGAVQLRGETPDDPVTRALIADVVREAEARASTLDASDALDSTGPRRRIQLGAVLALVATVLSLSFPAHAGTFLARALGGGPSWPQETYLTVEIPVIGEGFEVESTPELVHVRVARGTDVPVVVRAEGVVPDEVMLHFEGGRALALNATGVGLFRTLLRSLQEDVRFTVTGGDDEDHLPLVSVEVLQPPDVEGLAIAVTPPAYTGLDPELAFDRDVEVLAGSKVEVSVQVTPSDAEGTVRLLPEDRVLELTARPFPADPGAADEPVGPGEGLGFELWADRSLGFRIELVDAKGLSNPDPGLFRVAVIEDRAPEVQVLEPARGEIEVVLGGALPLRARIGDDFGLTSATWTVLNNTASDQGPGQVGNFALLPIQDDGDSGSTRARELGLASVRLEVDQLAGPDGTVLADQRYEIQVAARDNREPEANEGRSFPIRVRVVTPEELLRRMQDRLGQARLSALRLSDLQTEKRARTEELYAAADPDEARIDGRALSSAIAGQRRVVADARALAQELSVIAADVLYARIEEKAEGLLEAYDARVARSADARFRPEPWRELAAALESGRIRDAGFAAKLVTLVELALAISEDAAPAATLHLTEAERATSGEAGSAQLAAAVEQQDQTLRRIDELVDELAQWNNFQDVLQITRDLLNRQRTLRERTQKFAKEQDR